MSALGATEWVRVDDCSIDEDGTLLIKITGCSKEDVRTGESILPFGLDSRPQKGMMAVLAESEVRGEASVLGYMNAKNLKAAKGEVRLYAADANLVEKMYLWLKVNGTMEIGGAVDNMVRYSKLETAFNTLKSDLNNLVGKYNDLVGKFNAHVHPYVDTGGSPGTVTSPTTTTGTNGVTSSADITPAKINEIKTL